MTTPATGIDVRTSAQPLWRERSLKLKIALGDLRLAERTVRGAVPQDRPEEFDEQVDARDFWPNLPPGVQAVFLHSQPVAAPLPHLARLPVGIRHVTSHYNRHYIDLVGTFDDYCARLSYKSRSSLRRTARRFADCSGGTVDWREYRTPGELREFYDLGIAVSRLSWQSQEYDRGLPRRERFERLIATEGAEDRARGYILMLQGEPIAYAYNVIHGRRVMGELTGYDPRHAKLSPGTVLQWHILQSLFEAGQWDVFDFGPGDEGFKKILGTRTEFCADIYYFRPGIRNHLLVGLQWSLLSTNHLGGLVMDRMQLREPAKRFMHRITRLFRPQPGEPGDRDAPGGLKGV